MALAQEDIEKIRELIDKSMTSEFSDNKIPIDVIFDFSERITRLECTLQHVRDIVKNDSEKVDQRIEKLELLVGK